MLVVNAMRNKQCKFLQKTFIISLAIADMFTICMFAINHLRILRNELMVWTLGPFMCVFIPTGQVLGTTASSVALLAIALDRYQNVVYALSKRWNPSPRICISMAVGVYVLCSALAYPMATIFDYQPIKIYFVDKKTVEDAFMCVATKEKLTIYYCCIAALIFMPILTIFVWFYYNIATLVWKHRKPLHMRFKKKHQREDESTTTTKCSNTNSVPTVTMAHTLQKKKNLQVERKLRTFRIVVVLMITFVICRFPYWYYYVMRTICKLAGNFVWSIHYTFISLTMLNCALNPLLYTFLNQTINAFKTVNDFMCKICCCCFSNADFEDFEKENPFARENYQPEFQRVGKPNNDQFNKRCDKNNRTEKY
ncbi:unnamed protein product [Acanthoscelides obtectus]|uniref:G-protein coupled receptors family 1 profile domain-containing protein n=1 Tax=Acanthoscelides obtectus TaxID=200917 RepID=A0A9P0K296_ACAOB|nr:unnamed protein product [Acanthoscelides obtectus]CAK1647247.1 Octopamine receptor beta-2R [Acanthoscelides obtectus]